MSSSDRVTYAVILWATGEMRSANPARSLSVVMRSQSSLNRSTMRVAASKAWFAVSATPARKKSSQASQLPCSRTS